MTARRSEEIDRVNRIFSSSFEEPHTIVGDYKIFFRDYLHDVMTVTLIGVWLAWKDQDSPYYCCMCGDPRPLEYHKGEMLPVCHVETSVFSTPDMLIDAAETALNKLAEFLKYLQEV